ncbi:flagellar brake protein [Martelella lutilitoris]|uniref:Flagellar brake protein n=1 Tax=Martelella lutilitoris TaxID=2583532 RepID=A0A5C4JPH2_9HYPH|nr:flagellar brake protein [Martelella lutilitoris]TNB47112.1 flagellar brake protein [Martelella lutilitoris]
MLKINKMILCFCLTGCTLSDAVQYDVSALNGAEREKNALYCRKNPAPSGSEKGSDAAGTASKKTCEDPNKRARDDEIEYMAVIKQANLLATEYRRGAAAAARGQDVGAVGIILSAGTAAGGLLFGSSLNLVKGAGLGAGLMNSNMSYFKPRRAQISLLSAADQANCVADAGSPKPLNDADLAAGRLKIEAALGKIQNALMLSLVKDTPDYDALVDALYKIGTAGASRQAITAAEKTGNSLNALSARIDACLSPI